MVKRFFLITSFLFLNILCSADKIFFIYNSQDDFYTILTDTMHKAIKPETYPCLLCKLTYNTFNKKKKWKYFLSNLEYEPVFLYKGDKFIIENNISEFPLILFGSSNNLDVLLSKKEIDQNSNLDQLINMIDVKLKQYKAVN